MVRKVHKWYETSMVRKVYGTKSLAFVHTMNTETAPGGRRPLDQANRLEPQARLYRHPINRIHHRHLLSLLSQKADTRFTVPQTVEG